MLAALVLCVLAAGPAAQGQQRIETPVRPGPSPPTESSRSDGPRLPREADPVLRGMREAQEFLRQNRVEEGLARLRDLQEDNPENWQVAEALGRTLEAVGRREEAILLYRRVADRAAEPGPPLIELQRLYRAAELWPAALEVSLEYLRRVGEKDAWVAEEVESLIRTDRVGPEAVRAIEAARKDRPDDLRLRELLLLAQLYQGDATRAMDEAAALDRERRADGAVVLKYARLAQEKGKLEAALAGYDRLLRESKEEAMRDAVLLARAQTLRGLGRMPEALAAFEEAARLPRIGLAARTEKADLLAGQMGRPEEAAAEYRALLAEMNGRGARGPEIDRIRLTLADLEIRLGRPGEAAAIYEDLAAHASEPESRAQALFRAGEMLFFQGKLKEAEEAWYAVGDSFPGQRWVNDALEGVLRIGENNDEGGVPLAAYAQAEYQRRLGRLDRGLVLIDEALEKHPDSRAADDLRLQRVRLLLGLGRFPEARAAADTLANRHPESRLSPRAYWEVAERLAADPASVDLAQSICLEILMRFPESLEAPLARAALQRWKGTGHDGATPEGGS